MVIDTMEDKIKLILDSIAEENGEDVEKLDVRFYMIDGELCGHVDGGSLSDGFDGFAWESWNNMEDFEAMVEFYLNRKD